MYNPETGITYSTGSALSGSPYQSAQQQQNLATTKHALLLSKTGGNKKNKRGGIGQIQIPSSGNPIYKPVGTTTPNDIVLKNAQSQNAALVHSSGDNVPLAIPMKAGSRSYKNCKSKKCKSKKCKSKKCKSKKCKSKK